MAHDLPANGQFIPLADVPDLAFLPGRNGKKMHRSVAFRWAQKGLGPRQTRLRTVQIGGKKCTTLAFLQEFFSALETAAEQKSHHERVRRQRDSRRIDKELEMEGW